LIYDNWHNKLHQGKRYKAQPNYILFNHFLNKLQHNNHEENIKSEKYIISKSVAVPSFQLGILPVRHDIYTLKLPQKIARHLSKR